MQKKFLKVLAFILGATMVFNSAPSESYARARFEEEKAVERMWIATWSIVGVAVIAIVLGAAFTSGK